MKNILLTLLVVANLTYASEGYLGMYDTQIKEKRLYSKFCKNNKLGDEFCMEYELKYPIIKDTKNMKMKSLIEEIVEEKIRKFKKLDAQEEVLNLLSDDPEITWSWEDRTIIKLFATTEKSFTLAISNYNYSGGAHGNHTIEYENYNIESGEEIDIKDIFVKDFETRLTFTADRYYRESHHLSVSDSLTKIGWYGDKFILSDNFAITTEGLNFLYNPYEIKPYIAGITTFVLPYDRIETIMETEE